MMQWKLTKLSYVGWVESSRPTTHWKLVGLHESRRHRRVGQAAAKLSKYDTMIGEGLPTPPLVANGDRGSANVVDIQVRFGIVVPSASRIEIRIRVRRGANCQPPFMLR